MAKPKISALMEPVFFWWEWGWGGVVRGKGVGYVCICMSGHVHVVSVDSKAWENT